MNAVIYVVRSLVPMLPTFQFLFALTLLIIYEQQYFDFLTPHKRSFKASHCSHC